MSLETVQASKGHARIQYIDTMKAWAILCVVMGHVLIFNLYGNDNHSLLFGLIYSFHLPFVRSFFRSCYRYLQIQF